MDSIPRTDRLPYLHVPSGNAQRIGQQSQRATNLANKVEVRSRNIFQRALLWVKEWVQSRVQSARISRALAPFVKAAKADSAGVISAEHVKKMNSVLADGTNPHAIPLLAETVQDSIQSLNLVELKRFQSSLGQLSTTKTLPGKTLSDAVDRRIKDARINEAKSHLSNALGVFSEMSAKPFEAVFLISAIQSDLLTILDLFQPAEGSAAEAEASASQRITFDSASSVITLQALTTWFDGHSPAQKQRVKANLWSVASDYSQVSDGPKPEQAVFAFCQSVTTLLWPKDSRHAYFAD